MYKFDVEIETNNIVGGIKQYFADNKMQNAIIGISGGKDSFFVGKIMSLALGKLHVFGIMMPNGEQKDISDAKAAITELGINSFLINIGPAFTALSSAYPFNPENPAFDSNTPARLRMTTLYGMSHQIPDSLVINTCNLSEDSVGYSTFYGDSAGDFAPIRYYTVTEILAMGDYLGLSKNLIHKSPDDGMCGMSDEAKLSRELGMKFTYEKLDRLLRDNEDAFPTEKFTSEEKDKIFDKMKHTSYKISIINIPGVKPILG